jgi:hypothetical protein
MLTANIKHSYILLSKRLCCLKRPPAALPLPHLPGGYHEQDNTVRAIDVFVDGLDLEELGFKVHFPECGRPAYHPAALLKLYIYGYMNRMRSSRQLERECKRNIEVMWILESLCPDHNTISNFRRDNPGRSRGCSVQRSRSPGTSG